MLTLDFVFEIALTVGLVLVIAGIFMKTRWGINLTKIDCPRCHAAQPMLRKPTSMRQALWGGHTCAQCGCEMDKWGREIGQSKTA